MLTINSKVKVNYSLLIFFLLVTAFQFLFLNDIKAQTDEEKGLVIAIETDKRDLGFEDSTSDLKMILRNKNGDVSTRKMRNKTLEVSDDGDKSIVIFDTPRDVKGTAFLSFTHKNSPDDQWLYLPALKRVKRIASNNKSGPFMGSEFAFEDISSQEVEKYKYKYLKDEVYENTDCFLVERYPVDKYSGYSKQTVWIDKAEYKIMKVDFYDRKNDLLKTLTYHKYQQYLNKFWRAHEMRMVNHLTGKSTELLFSNYTFQNELNDRDFDKNSLQRAR